jgi:hypothetical protein
MTRNPLPATAGYAKLLTLSGFTRSLNSLYGRPHLQTAICVYGRCALHRLGYVFDMDTRRESWIAIVLCRHSWACP